MGKIDHLLVCRFARLYSWFFEESLYKDLKTKDLLKHEPISKFVSEAKRPDDFDWHLGRVRFLFDELIAGKDLEPVMVDNHCHGSHIYAEPVLLDGHHRLAAHWFARRRTIPAYYSGRMDLLDYLTGKRPYTWLRAQP